LAAAAGWGCVGGFGFGWLWMSVSLFRWLSFEVLTKGIEGLQGSQTGLRPEGIFIQALRFKAIHCESITHQEVVEVE
jgi:hypothetical protein